MSNLTDFFSGSGGGAGVFGANVFADIIIVGGGGGAACSTASNCAPTAPNTTILRYPGGGGGGIYRLRYGLNCDQTYPITVGAGGAAGPSDTGTQGTTQAENGSPSKFDGNRFIAYGGGGGGSYCYCSPNPGADAHAYGKAGGQGGSGIGQICWSQLDASYASFGSQFGYHYGNAFTIMRGQVCPAPLAYPDDATKPINEYDLSGSSACDAFARPGWFCAGAPSPTAATFGCAFSTGQANSGDGAGSCNGPAAGGSGFVVVSYPTSHRAAPARPGSNDCSPYTPGYYTYVFTSSGSITL